MIDSTGLRVHSGNGRPPRRRAWRKLHIVVDANTGGIHASVLTTNRARDAAQVPALLSQIDAPLSSVRADGAYDTKSTYATITSRDPEPVTILIPPRHDATVAKYPDGVDLL